MNPTLEAIRDAIEGTPYAGRVFLVGGAVRDWLLSRSEPKDLDLVTELDSAELAEWLHGRGVADFRPVTYPRFGTAMVQIAGKPVELITARRESYRGDSRKPVTEPATLEEDALRRDFTVNALLLDLRTLEVRDPLGQGLDDLRAGVLRTPLDPKLTFAEDPLRMLRAVRFRWQLGFTPAPGLYEAIRETGQRLAIISFERIRDELTRMLVLRDADRCLADLAGLGLMGHIAPEFLAMAGVTQGDYHHLDVWEHTLLAVRSAPPDLETRLAALLHDVGKPATRTVEPGGRIRFFGHEGAGEKMARVILDRWRLPGATIDRVARLVAGHMRLCSGAKLSPPAARRLIRDFPDDWRMLLDLMEADAAAMRPEVPKLDFDGLRGQLAQAENATPPATLRSPLSGEQIMLRLGLEPGARIGEAKEHLADLVISGELAPGDVEGALAALDAWWRRRR